MFPVYLIFFCTLNIHYITVIEHLVLYFLCVFLQTITLKLLTIIIQKIKVHLLAYVFSIFVSSSDNFHFNGSVVFRSRVCWVFKLNKS